MCLTDLDLRHIHRKYRIFEVGLKVGGKIMMEGLDRSLIWPEDEMLEGFPAALKNPMDEAD